MDFGVLPPEINSGRMYAGPGSGPMRAAGAAWDDLAAQLYLSAASYGSVISGLAAAWQGPSSATMAAAAAPYRAWMIGTAAQAEQTASQARAAAAAYETAFTATVPPPVIAANRALLIVADRDQSFRPEHRGDRGHRGPLRRNVGPGCGGDVRLCGLLVDCLRDDSRSAPPPQTANPAAATGQATAVAHATATSAAANAHTVSQLTTATPQTAQSLATSTSTSAADPTSSSILSEFLIGPYNPLKLYSPIGGNYDFGFQNFLAELQQAEPAAGIRRGRQQSRSRPWSGHHVLGRPAGSARGRQLRRGRELVGSAQLGQRRPGDQAGRLRVAANRPGRCLGGARDGGQGSVFSNMALSGLTGRAIAGTAGGDVARSVGGGGDAIAGADTAVTIIVIPED